jgi:hypothetical protein
MLTPILMTAGVSDPHPAMILPFALMLLAIALMPFINLHWWERHFPQVSVVLGAVTTIYYVFLLGNSGRMLHVAHEYVSFIALIGSLFVVAGGTHFQVKGESGRGPIACFSSSELCWPTSSAPREPPCYLSGPGCERISTASPLFTSCFSFLSSATSVVASPPLAIPPVPGVYQRRAFLVGVEEMLGSVGNCRRGLNRCLLRF